LFYCYFRLFIFLCTKNRRSKIKNNAYKDEYTNNSSSTKLKTIATNADLIPKIKILSPPNGQKIPLTNNNLVIFNASSYDRSTRCEVSTLLNGVKPYQKTIATGKNGANDYSTWKYKLDPSYTTIREGSNKLTAKVSCLDNPNSFSKWTSISLIGTRDINGSTTTIGAAQPMSLQTSINVNKNPIAAGDIQSIIVKLHGPGITNTAVSGAKVSGQIIDLSSLSSSSSFLLKIWIQL